ncbi:hypothetical protein LF1_19770 [Rubripirellula obstinata]|uniref:Uncharacterized protein n=1 Tax=Rubripirellula obstinata TaxID=406547 RepID=A0A5B1CHM1_9BACT|nr:BBP7 family outer membrane beta-barrel protein [Rubripirellula obstinata]KAA1259445.1 hypothetical protein LF1_19770 [Rubripirellula obstinata]
MSVRKLTAGVLTILAMLGSIAGVSAQEHFNNLPPADPFAFDPDFRWFEPVYNMDLADMKAKHRAPTGWFGTYDRLSLYGSRPETNDSQSAETKLDNGWGHRYEVGYMTPEKSGWTFNWTEMGVSEGNYIRHEAANRVNENAIVSNVQQDSFPFETNVPGTNYRFFDVGDSTNIFNYDSYELNRTWRMEPYHYGGILEPMIGVRWMRIDDISLSTRLNTDGDLTGAGVIGDLPGFDQLLSDQSITENEMFGGQIGFRYFKYRDRFTYSADFRVFSGGNWQCSTSFSDELLIDYGGTPVGEGDDVVGVQRDRTATTYERNEDIFVGFDVRGELGYQLTKMVSIRAGFQIIDIGTGLWRGGSQQGRITGGDMDQDLFMVGGTFGLSLNH